MTAQAKLNVQHDFVTLRIKFADGSKLNLTSNRRGQTVSGSGEIEALESALNAFTAFMEFKDGEKIGAKMERLTALAQASVTMTDLINSMRPVSA